MSRIDLRGIGNNAHKFIRSLKTEMIPAFIIEMSKNYIFAFIYQLTGDQMLYTILQGLILLAPWIMLGHGAFRYESQKTYNFSSLSNHNSPNTLKPKKNLNLLSFILATFVFMKFLLQ